MRELWFQLRWALPAWLIGLFTNWLPDNRIVLRLRGCLMRPFIGRCGRGFQLGAYVSLLNAHRLQVGDNVYMARGCWVNSLGGMSIEDEVALAPYVVVSTVQHVFKNRSVFQGGSIARAVHIGKGSWLAAHVAVKCGVTIGRGNVVAANACVIRDTPDYVVVGGVPATVICENTDGAAEFYRRSDVPKA